MIGKEVCMWNVTGENGGSDKTIDLAVKDVCLMSRQV